MANWRRWERPGWPPPRRDRSETPSPLSWGAGEAVPSHEVIHLLDAQLRNSNGHKNLGICLAVTVLGGFPDGEKAPGIPTSDDLRSAGWVGWVGWQPRCLDTQGQTLESMGQALPQEPFSRYAG